MNLAQHLGERFPRRHLVHYGALGLAGLLMAGSALVSFVQGSASIGVIIQVVGALLVVGASLYGLLKPERSSTDIGGLVWLSVVAVLLLVLAVTVTIVG
jgi:hypothetical protein